MLPCHVWVDLTNTWGDQARPGVLIAWRRGGRGWEGWVLVAATYPTGGGSEMEVRQCWVPAGLLRPAVSVPPARDHSAFRQKGAGR